MDLEDQLIAVVTAHPRGLDIAELVERVFPLPRSTKARRRAFERGEVKRAVGRLRQDGRVVTERRGDRLLVIPR
jgi:hypothetical protein